MTSNVFPFSWVNSPRTFSPKNTFGFIYMKKRKYGRANEFV
jgi:hypothetical protein